MDWVIVIWSGFVATTLTASFFWTAHSFGWTAFNPTVQIGHLLVDDPRRPLTETVGLLILFAGGSTIAPALYQAALTLWGGPNWMGGLVVGGFVGIVTSAALPFVGTIRARTRGGTTPPPGPFGIGWGKLTPGIVVAGSMIYGVVVAAVLASF
ncbi:MAG: hypothetical protein WD737_10065 [Gemmatimonadota bacterium]